MRHSIDLCGRWAMEYSAERPECGSTLPAFDSGFVTDAVPGWWEDMMPALQMAPYWKDVCFNPEYRPLRYPMTGSVPDMVLETIVGCFWYRREVQVTVKEAGMRALLRFGGVQNRALAWVNGVFAGEHNGYSSPFVLDVTGRLHEGVNEIVFAAANHQAVNEQGEPISGCTSRAANRYTGGVTGGIELEFLPEIAVRDLYVSAWDEESDSFTVYAGFYGEPELLKWEILDNGDVLREGTSASRCFTLERGVLDFWSPETPKRYTLRISVPGDAAELEFGIRGLKAEGYKLTLNGAPIFLRGICEHGYFAKTVHPDPDAAYYRHVIRTQKALGFNFIRFHTWVPNEGYLRAADELGMLLHIESPNNTTEAEWNDILRFVRRHPSAVICCTGNELLIDDAGVEHLERCSEACHTLAPGMLFSPMSALRGVEYCWEPGNYGDDICDVPFRHNPGRLARLRECSDVFSSYALGLLSYDSDKADPALIDSWADLYKRPRLSHEICIHGTYIDLDMENRYEGTRIGESELYSSVRRILREAGLLHRAPLYYRNSCRWQQMLRKHCFESARLCKTLAGYDYLGDIDTHWHTFGYRAGMMNEFYEMKPHESVDDVRRYNSGSVILCDLGLKRNFLAGEPVRVGFALSLFDADMEEGVLNVRIETADRRVVDRFAFDYEAQNGAVTDIAVLETAAPETDRPTHYRLFATISGPSAELENCWDVFVFPEAREVEADNVIMTDTLDEASLAVLESGGDILLEGAGPFFANPLNFRISLAGRTAGNLATVIEEHPLNDTYDHEGFCGWQFASMIDRAECVYYPPETEVPFDPIVEVVSSYKWIRRQAAVAELRVGKGRLLYSTFRMDPEDPAGAWWHENLLRYMTGKKFAPKTAVTAAQLRTLFSDGTSAAGSTNDNRAGNANDKTMKK